MTNCTTAGPTPSSSTTSRSRTPTRPVRCSSSSSSSSEKSARAEAREDGKNGGMGEPFWRKAAPFPNLPPKAFDWRGGRKAFRRAAAGSPMASARPASPSLFREPKRGLCNVVADISGIRLFPIPPVEARQPFFPGRGSREPKARMRCGRLGVAPFPSGDSISFSTPCAERI